MKTVKSGGSSSVFRKAFTVTDGMRSAFEIIAILKRPSVGLREIFCISVLIWSTVITRDFDSGRITSRSGKLLVSNLRHAMHFPQESSGILVSLILDGDWQFSVRANSIAFNSRFFISPPTNI